MKLHDFLDEGVHDGRNPCILPVLLLCDMEPDPDIQAWAEQEIAEEVNLVVPGVLDPAPEADGHVPDPTVLQARQVIIQHREVVNVHTTGAELPD